MSMLIFIASFLGMVILVPAIWYGFFRLGIFLRANILARGKFIYTLIHFQHLDSKPQLMDNPNFLKTGKWEYIPEADYYKGFSKLSDRDLRLWLQNEYQLKPGQVLVSVPESMKVASAGF